MYRSLNTQMLGHRVPFTELCTLAVKYGFEGVDLNGDDLRDMGADAIRDMLQAHGLRPGLISLPLNYKGSRSELDTSLQAVSELAPLAASLGYVRTTTVIMPGDSRRGFAENWAFHVERLSPLAERLDYYGICLGFEYIGPKTLRDTFAYPFLHSLDSVLGLCAAIGTPNLGLLVDLFHVYTSHGDFEEISKLRNKDIVLVHLNDAQAGLGPDEQMDLVRALPGTTGVTDCAGFLKVLQGLGYDGPCSVEPFVSRFREMAVEDVVAETTASLTRVWSAAGLDQD